MLAKRQTSQLCNIQEFTATGIPSTLQLEVIAITMHYSLENTHKKSSTKNHDYCYNVPCM